MMPMASPAPRGRMSMLIAQNGPGITNFVTAVKTAYWNHSPLLLVTPQAANKTIGQGGFQEVEQMALFKDMVAYQEEVRDPSRIAEVLTRVIAQAKRHSAPAQINVPRDVFTQVVDIELPPILAFERPRAVRSRSPRRRSCCRRRSSRSSSTAPAWSCHRAASKRRARWPRLSMRRSAAAISTTTRSRVRIRCSPGRSAITARRRRCS